MEGTLKSVLRLGSAFRFQKVHPPGFGGWASLPSLFPLSPLRCSVGILSFLVSIGLLMHLFLEVLVALVIL